MSSLICPRCYRGIVRPCAANNTILWKCTKCSRDFQTNLIHTTVLVARNLLDDLGEIQKTKTVSLIEFVAILEPQNVLAAETLLKKLQKTFTKNHYLILELEQNMVALYTQTLPNTKNLTRKIELCQHLIEIFKIIEPGISRLQGLPSHHLQSKQN